MANKPATCHPCRLLSLVGLLLALTSGCSKIPTWGELTGQAKPEPAPAPQPAPAPVVAPTVPSTPVQPPPPDPAVVLQNFRTLKPGQITDAELGKLGQLTEGLDQITEIDAQGGQVTQAGLAVVEKLPNLRFINLDGTSIGDADVGLLTRAPALESVRLNGANLTDTGIAALGPLSNLRELVITRARLTREGFAEIATHQTLERLVIESTPLDDASFAILCGLKNLNFLSMGDTQVSDVGLMNLAKLDKLVTLDVSRSPNVHGEFLFRLGKSRGLQSLRHLSIGICPLNERGALGINSCKQLESLRVNYTSASDVHLAAMIKGLTQLRYLVMNNNAEVTNEIFKVIGQLKSLEVLFVDYQPAVSDVGLTYLKGLKKLKFLSVGNTGVTPDGLVALQRFCPELNLQTNVPPANPFVLPKPGEVLADAPRPAQPTRPSQARPATPRNGKSSGFIRPE